MDGPMEQSSHTHDQTLTARDPLARSVLSGPLQRHNIISVHWLQNL